MPLSCIAEVREITRSDLTSERSAISSSIPSLRRPPAPASRKIAHGSSGGPLVTEEGQVVVRVKTTGTKITQVVSVEADSAAAKAGLQSGDVLQQVKFVATTKKAKTQIRINVAGYSADKAALAEVLKEALADFAFYKGQASLRWWRGQAVLDRCDVLVSSASYGGVLSRFYTRNRYR